LGPSSFLLSVKDLSLPWATPTRIQVVRELRKCSSLIHKGGPRRMGLKCKHAHGQLVRLLWKVTFEKNMLI
jgi:hypothetical protein